METARSITLPRRVEAFFVELSIKKFAALLGVLLLLLFAPVLLGVKTFFFRDYALFGYPLAAWHRHMIWQGELPFWNPYNNCGLPFLAQWNTLVFYPGTILYLVLPLSWGLGLFCVFHLWLAGVGMFALAQGWSRCTFAAAVAGLAYAFNGVLLSSLKWPNNIAAFGLMPWVVLFVQRGWRDGGASLIRGGLIAACQMFTGAPEIIMLTWLFLLGLLALDLRGFFEFSLLLRFALAAALTACLSAIQLLPFLDLLSHSQRNAAFNSSAWSMPPWGFVNFFLPLYRSFASYHGVFAQQDQYWISSYYPGIVIVLLAILAPLSRSGSLARWLGALLLLALLMALGPRAIFYSIAQKVVPVFSMMRFPIKFVSLAALIFPLLAALSIARWNRRRSPALLWSAAAAALVVIAATLAAGQAGLWPNAIFRLIALGAAAVLLSLPQLSTGLFRGLFLFLLAFDLLTHAPWQNPLVVPWVYQAGIPDLKPPPALGQSRAMVSPEAEYRLDHILPQTPRDDVLTTRLSLFCDANLIDRIPKVNGFFSLYLKEEAEVEDLFYKGTNRPPAPLLGFLSVSHLTEQGKTVSWEPRNSRLPWITAGQRTRLLPPEQILREMARPDWNPIETVLLPSPVRAPMIANQTPVTIREARFSPSSISFTVSNPQRAWIVINQAWHHNWKASIDGMSTELFRVNHAFQGLQAPPGKHQIKLIYDDSLFALGFGISSISLAGSLLLLRALTPRTMRPA